MSDLEALLRKSLEQRHMKPLQAVQDLHAIAAELSAAIRSVTGDRMSLVLERLTPKPKHGPTFAVILKLPDEEIVLRVVVIADEAGYPATLWASYSEWDTQQPNYPTSAFTLPDRATLRENLQHLIDGPQSEIVRIIDNQLAVLSDESGTLAGSAAG